MDAVLRHLQRIGTKAVQALERNLDANRPQVQVRAAVAVLSQLLRLAEALDLAERVKELERQLAGKGGAP